MGSKVLGKELENGDSAVSPSVASSHVKAGYQALSHHLMLTEDGPDVVAVIAYNGQNVLQLCPGGHLPCMISDWCTCQTLMD